MHSHTSRAAALGVFLLTLLAGLPAAHAQSVHRCTDGTRTYWSDKPCGNNGQTRITSFGPAPTRESHSRQSEPSLSKAPEYQAYLTQECASILDAIRTASARGVGHATQRDLREEYEQKCRDADRDARRQAQQARNQKRDEERNVRVAQQQQRVQATTSLEQCRELGRILAERRKRQDSMNAGERADLERSQTNFNERCKGL